VIASLFNFVANDLWTFGRLKLNRQAQDGRQPDPNDA
jgi:putative flippase GtrA